MEKEKAEKQTLKNARKLARELRKKEKEEQKKENELLKKTKLAQREGKNRKSINKEAPRNIGEKI